MDEFYRISFNRILMSTTTVLFENRRDKYHFIYYTQPIILKPEYTPLEDK